MGFFTKADVQTLSESEVLQQKIKTARLNILWIVLFTAINSILFIVGSDTYFVFSATLPYHAIVLAFGLTPQGGSPVFPALAIAFLVITIAAYIVCLVMGRKHIGWLIAALVMFAIDTLYFLYVFASLYIPMMVTEQDYIINNLIHLLLHGYALYYFIIAVVNSFKLKELCRKEAENEVATINVQSDEEAEDATYN